MSKSNPSPQLEAFGPDVTNKGKYEEEVTIDLNTTQTNQEREYREFIRHEVESEAKNLMNMLSLHCAKVAVGFFVYFVPGNPAPVQFAAVTYFVLSILEQVYVLHKRLSAKSRSYMRLFLAVVETLCVIGLIIIDSKPGLKLMVPTYLLLAMFNLMMTCLEFSESIDEVFNVKIVTPAHQTTVIPKLLFIMQFMLIVLKRSEVVDWNWSSVISISFIIMIFCIVGLVCLVGVSAVKAAGYFMKKTKGAEGSLVSTAVGLLLYATVYFAVQIVSVLVVFASINGFAAISSDDSSSSPVPESDSSAPLARNLFVDQMSFASGLVVLVPNFFLAAVRVVLRVSLL